KNNLNIDMAKVTYVLNTTYSAYITEKEYSEKFVTERVESVLKVDVPSIAFRPTSLARVKCGDEKSCDSVEHYTRGYVGGKMVVVWLPCIADSNLVHELLHLLEYVFEGKSLMDHDRYVFSHVGDRNFQPLESRLLEFFRDRYCGEKL
ncbi:MAG: hypothetical protein MJA83_09645, partial [Gammaproteobacteria bacterium]|nr:hypothetical protein [Gammaproteobacteria bacterium]